MEYIYLIVALVMAVVWAEVTKNTMANKGYDRKTCNTWRVLGFFFGLFALLFAVSKPALNAPAGSRPGSASGADELKKYKELLDDGVITQEEFDRKKKEILQL